MAVTVGVLVISGLGVFASTLTRATTMDMGIQSGHLILGLHPHLVATTLAEVEQQWSTQVVAFLQCRKLTHDRMACDGAATAFHRSCEKIARTLVVANQGDREDVVDHMKIVCTQSELSLPQQEQCNKLAFLLESVMSADDAANLEGLSDLASMCDKFWFAYLEVKKNHVERESTKTAHQVEKAREELTRRKNLEGEMTAQKLAQKKMKVGQFEGSVKAVLSAKRDVQRDVQNRTIATPAKKDPGFLELHRLALRPDLAARTLALVESQWVEQVSSFVECSLALGDKAECFAASRAFMSSCSHVANAIIKASDGERARVVEYMEDVCRDPGLKHWQRAYCETLASGVVGLMSIDSGYNRQANIGVEPVCTILWSAISNEQQHIAEAKLRAGVPCGEDIIKGDVSKLSMQKDLLVKHHKAAPIKVGEKATVNEVAVTLPGKKAATLPKHAVKANGDQFASLDSKISTHKDLLVKHHKVAETVKVTEALTLPAQKTAFPNQALNVTQSGDAKLFESAKDVDMDKSGTTAVLNHTTSVKAEIEGEVRNTMIATSAKNKTNLGFLEVNLAL